MFKTVTTPSKLVPNPSTTTHYWYRPTTQEGTSQRPAGQWCVLQIVPASDNGWPAYVEGDRNCKDVASYPGDWALCPTPDSDEYQTAFLNKANDKALS